MNKHDKAEPAIATSLPKKSKDGKTLTVDLRKDAKWSNGDPVTADDFVFAWRKVVNPKTASEFAYIMSDIKMLMTLMLERNQLKTLESKH